MKKAALTLIACAALLIGPQLGARKIATTRGRLRTAVTETQTCDSAVATGDSAMILRGYDKPLRSSKESIFVTNTLDLGVTAVHITIDYTDLQGRQLHRRARWIATDIPPRQTRQLSFPSWDRQQAFYYHLSRPPRSSAAPYRITAVIDSVTVRGNRSDGGE